MADKALFDAVSDLEGAVIVIEDIQNVLSVFDDQLWEWWEGVKSLAPLQHTEVDNSFNVVYSLLTLSRRQLLDVVDTANAGVKKAYDALKANKAT